MAQHNFFINLLLVLLILSGDFLKSTNTQRSLLKKKSNKTRSGGGVDGDLFVNGKFRAINGIYSTTITGTIKNTPLNDVSITTTSIIIGRTQKSQNVLKAAYNTNENNYGIEASDGSFTINAGSNRKFYINNTSDSSKNIMLLNIPAGVHNFLSIDSSGRLHRNLSSKKYKKNIKKINPSADTICKLEPLSFNFIHDDEDTIQYGLIAEDVLEILPEIVIFNEKGESESINYLMVQMLMLAQLIANTKKIIELESIIENLNKKIDKPKK